MRLTRKNNNEYVYDNYIYLNEPIKSIVTKLGQLEDILEKYNLDNANDLDIEIRANRDKVYKYESIGKKLGIDLITLFKAYKNGFYVKGEEGKQYISFECSTNSIAFKFKEMFYGNKWSYEYVKLYDYGKTWALTREELEI